jgi:hypothetical protein
MSETFDPIVPPPPPPPPRKSRTGMIAGIAAAVVVLCICCVLIGVVVYEQRDKIPIISGLFATPTPTGAVYSNSTMGIRLYYPLEWVYQEDQTGEMVFLASSQEALDASVFPETAAAMVLFRSTSLYENFPTNVDLKSPEAVLKYLVSADAGFLSEGATEYEPIRSYSIKGNSAASTVYAIAQTNSFTYNQYIVVIATGDVPILAIGVASQSNWDSYRPTLDGILNSIEVQPTQ